MNRKWLLWAIIILMVVLFLLNRKATELHWYYYIWWFDIVMHFWAGAWVGLFFIYLLSSGEVLSYSIFLVVFSVLFVGISWEIFEIVVFNNIGQVPFNLSDTLSDVAFDLAGGLLALICFPRRFVSIIP